MLELHLQDSVVDEVTFRGRPCFVKRDDLLRPFSGNKARKLEGLLQLDWSKIDVIISHGGAQSNAMLALATLAAYKNVQLIYYTRKQPSWLKRNSLGNLKAALDLGMKLVETATGTPPELVAERALLVPRGISMPEAEQGIARLAQEITDFAVRKNLAELSVFVPSGTGATALYLQKHLHFPVSTVPCVGDADYLREQFTNLESNTSKYPHIISCPEKFALGKLDKRLLKIWQELKAATGIEFDLLYDPVAWLAMQNWHPDTSVMYIHCGGTEGNASMLRRYERAALG